MTNAARAQLDSPLLDTDALDLEAAEHVTYVLRQRFRYDYDRPAYELDHRLVVVPRAHHGSLRRRVHAVDVSIPDAQVRQRRDASATSSCDVGRRCRAALVEFTVVAVIERVGRGSTLGLPELP